MNRPGNLLLVPMVAAVTFGLMATKAEAQGGPRVKTNAQEKSTWYSAPHEFQIVDERPVIKDFRSAPQAAGSIELPPAPQGFGGAGGGGGSGALGGGSGAAPPAGGIGIPGSGPAYRSEQAALPKSGFGGSNIGKGLHPGGMLPGVNQGIVGKMMNQQKPGPGSAGPAKGMSVNPGHTSGNSSAPAAATYSGGYGSGSGSSFGGSASRTDTSVRGSLLRK
jgi:hypothetical protein